MVNSVGRIEIKMGKDCQRKLTAYHQRFNNWIKKLRGLEWNSFWWSDHYQKKTTNDDNVIIIRSFSPLSFCWKFDYFQSKWRVARYNTTIREDTNNKKEEYDEYFAEGCISESNNYYLYMFMTSLRREPIKGHQNCPIATIWCGIK